MAPAGAAEAAKPIDGRRQSLAALGAGLVSVLLWASAFVGIRAAGHEISPGSLALGRLAIATVVLGALAASRGDLLPKRRDLPALAACSVLWFALYNVALNEAERRVDAGTAAMIVNLGPILVAVLAGVFLREGFPPALFAGCLIALCGAALIGVASSEGDRSAGIGIALALVAAGSYAVAVVVQKPLLRSMSPLKLTWLACAMATVACLPFAPDLVGELQTATGSAVRWVIYLGIFPTALAFTTWGYALARTAAGRLASLTYLVPPLVVIMSWAALGEAPPALAMLGGLLCLAGVATARLRVG